MPWLWNLWLERCGHSSTPSNRVWDPLPWRHGSTLHVLGATASRASAASHHACGREEVPRCWADSETRPQGPAQRPLLKDGEAGPRAGLSRSGQPRRQPDASSRLCRPYPHPTGPGPTRLGAGTSGTGRRRVIAGSTQVGHFHLAARSTVHGAHPLRASQVGFGLPGGPPAPSAGPAPTAVA